ncbi:MAG: pimeloyl-ACP methyl ester carboxylesterase [Natronomonas sp.]|jgi:pimeloyl-ACP methyl ester carboxylesterase|uniref:alpha/beta hydrolase family protein n=1 Tax=Natronomonas sp. TaxID=2184060 RepID=UPI003989A6AA
MADTHTVPVGDDSDESIAAVHHTPDSDTDAERRWLVFCHGFRSDKTGSYESRCKRAVAEGYDAVRFDFRGSGDSDGAFIDQTLGSRMRDLRAVLEYFDPDECVLFGSSFGAKVALHTAKDDPRIEAVVGRAPVTYNRAFEPYRGLVREAGTLQLDADHAIDARFFEEFDDHPFTEVEAALDVPVALVHGTDDDSVSVTDSLDAAANLGTDVLLQKYTDEGHRFSEGAEARLRQQVFDWLAVV